MGPASNNPKVAIPVPHSHDQPYAARALPQYEAAVRKAGGHPVTIPLDGAATDLRRQIQDCDAILLPGSKADVDPAKYGAVRDSNTADPDQKRDSVDEALLQHAYQARKPVLGICYGLQILNVHRGGTLLQHIDSAVRHNAGRAVPRAHDVQIDHGSRLAAIIGVPQTTGVPVNSSHHQSAARLGDGLHAVARCPNDGIIEAIEGTSPDHFVLAVQWHPERSVDEPGPLGDSARAIFNAFIESARNRKK